MPENVIYRLNSLTKQYAERQVLNIDSLEVNRGEILALVGPSGSGKSTLLRLLNFLESATTGIIAYNGQEYSAGETPPLEQRRSVTTVFQRPMLLDRLVVDNVAFGLRLRGEQDGSASVRQVLEAVGLAGLAHARARSLSGGEAQRVALARAMVVEPQVLLLDEPTANLDPYNVGLIEKIIAELNWTQGVTLVLVTHNVFQARRLADRVAFLLDGRIVEVGPTEQIFDHPQDRRTLAFVRGEMVY